MQGAIAERNPGIRTYAAPDFVSLYGPDQPLDRYPVSPSPGYIYMGSGG